MITKLLRFRKLHEETSGIKRFFIFLRAILVFRKLSMNFQRTVFLPVEAEAFTYFGVRILRFPFISKLGHHIHSYVGTGHYAYLAIEELKHERVFRELFHLRWAILQHYYSKRHLNDWRRRMLLETFFTYLQPWKYGKGWCLKIRTILRRKCFYSKDVRWYRTQSQLTVKIIRRSDTKEIESPWLPIYIKELAYLLEFVGKPKSAEVYRKFLTNVTIK